MTKSKPTSAMATDDYPGAGLGLPPSGAGALAKWMSRITGLVLDWVISMIIGVLIFGIGSLSATGWQQFITYGVFFIETTALVAITGASLGQLIMGITVVRLDGKPMGLLRAFARSVMVCLIIPALVIGADRRGLQDLALGTAVLTRR